MKLSRDSWLAIGLLVTLVLVTVAAGIQEGRKAELPALTSTSSAPNGALALRMWLKELDYRVFDPKLTAFNIPNNVDVVLMLEPLGFESEGELKLVEEWVSKGGTLVIAGNGYGSSQLADRFGLGISFGFNPQSELVPQTPLLDSPPQEFPIVVDRAGHIYAYTGENENFVTHLADDGQPVMVSFEHGRGRVILVSTSYPFTNAGLKENGSASLVLNALSMARKDDMIWFDDWHHNVRSGSELVGPDAWLKYTPAGRSLLLVVGIVFLALLLGGRAFGRPVPQIEETRRRGIMEHITAVANLNRRAKHRKAVLGHYHRILKRHFGKRYRLDTSMPDDEFVAALERYNPAIDGQSLLALLTKLRQDASESEMVALASLVADLMEK